MEKRIECEIVQDLLLGYSDRTLNNESKKLVDKHLIECQECQNKFKEIENDIKENESNEKKQIDYLKKIRRKNKIKSLMTALGIIIFIAFVIFLRKLIIVNSFMGKAEKTLETNNFYKESISILNSSQTSVNKVYYKDGKYKEVGELYSDEGVQLVFTQYTELDSDEIIRVDHINQKVIISKNDMNKSMNREYNLKFVPFVKDERISYRLAVAFSKSIYKEYDGENEYYVLNNIFDKRNSWEGWIDTETGLPLKIVDREGRKSRYPNTEVIKEVLDNISEYKYKFNVVTDEDVAIPDVSGYEVEYSSN